MRQSQIEFERVRESSRQSDRQLERVRDSQKERVRDSQKERVRESLFTKSLLMHF